MSNSSDAAPGADADMLTDEQRAKVVRRRALLYASILRNQWHVPSFESPLCTHVFLNEMYERAVFFWSTDDLRAYNCATSPSLGDLHKMTVTAIKQGIKQKKFRENSENELLSVEKLLQHLAKRQADKYYYL